MAEDLTTVVSSGSQTVEINRDRPTVIIGERINPTGRKKVLAALQEAQAVGEVATREDALALARNILHGYEKKWIYDNNRTSTYTNLDPGEYTFSFKGSNRDGVWNETGKTISITINPPWWFTFWAYAGYLIIFVGIVFGVDRIQRRRLIAKTKERLKYQEAEHRAEAAELKAQAVEAQALVVQAENERKTKELEEARQLQLSMLPKELPQLPNLDIAVYMKTATEVGGDYYDFHIGIDGTLTVVVGDATGHGMKAGTMVTTTKSLFNVLAPNPNIVDTFHEMTRCLKLMHLEKLSMCMTFLYDY